MENDKKNKNKEKASEVIKLKEDKIKKFELPEIFLFNPENRPTKYKGADLKSIKAMVKEAQNFEKAVSGKTFWYIGQALHYILEKKLYKEDGYENFYSFALKEFDYQSQSIVSRILKVYYAFSDEEAKRIPGSVLTLAVAHVNFINYPEKQSKTKDIEKLKANREAIFNYFNEKLEKGIQPSFREFSDFLRGNIIDKSSKKLKRNNSNREHYESEGFEIFIDRSKTTKPVHLFEDKLLHIDFERLRDEGVSNKVIRKLENDIMNLLEKHQVIDN